MAYFENLKALLKIEKEEDKKQYEALTQHTSVSERRAAGLTWYPVAIRGTEMTRGEYLNVELERTTHHDINHQFRFGVPAVFFSNHEPQKDRIEGLVTYQGGNRLKLNIRTDELPDWASDGKLGVEVLFDNSSYEEMFSAMKTAHNELEKNELYQVIIGSKPAIAHDELENVKFEKLNESQNAAANKIIKSNHLAIVHGPPGTGKTTTLVEVIQHFVKVKNEKVLVVAPSNIAVDLLTEILSEAGLNVMRVGNPGRISEHLQGQSLDGKIQNHPAYKDIKKWKKQASEYKNMAHKYKRNFGKAERDQRKALFDEAYKLMKEVEKIEQYILEDLGQKTQVVTATLVGSNHYTVRDLTYDTVVIDEAGQTTEPACWIPIQKGKKLVLAGDHCQLPPTIKSTQNTAEGLTYTLLEKLVEKQKDAVTLLQTQYRMHQDIMAYSSKVFYENKLIAHESVADLKLYNLPALQFIDTAGKGFEEKLEGTSSTNPEEALFLVQRIESFFEEITKTENAKLPEIGVISPYKKQASIIDDLVQNSEILKPFLKQISVNTVDSFQGQERDAIFISLTRSNAEGVIGFLGDTRRMNVAMTRAKSHLLIVGDSATIGSHKFYADFITYTQEINAYKSIWEFE
jgi:ATP-dependent RNA/DNA helicase IGHMBP2